MNPISQTIQKLFSPHKGILANDASVASLTKRLNKYGIEATEENRNTFRKIFYTTSGVEQYISGVILNEEATSFTPLLTQKDIVPGVKVDTGLHPFGNLGKEYTTSGLNDLDARLTRHKTAGARFTKWRAVFVISPTTPSQQAIEENIRLLIEFAKLSHAHNLLPILEAEVLMEGDHSLDECAAASRKILNALFSQLKKEGIPIEKIILKTNMIVPGDTRTQISPLNIGRYTIDTLNTVVPKEIAGVVFLSGGQTGEQAIENLHAILTYHRTGGLKTLPYPLTFSFERVFEEPVLNIWCKNLDNIKGAQRVFLETAKRVSDALSF